MKTYGNYEKLYKAIRQYDTKQAAVTHIKDLTEIHEIWSFYEKLTLEELRLIGAAIRKTEAQLGYIPFCFSTVPFVFLIFSAKLSNLVKEDLKLLFAIILALTLFAIYIIQLHFKHKAYNSLHRHIVDSIIEIKLSDEEA
ncbi:hypothetical protein ACQCN2_00250 [Brevibacillus ginsengisoli]|uniref:hypothetical protein n=1 Tax=Brevibacillus ginsengisoli TaxID=363854 RepID=UPI003CF2EAE1